MKNIKVYANCTDSLKYCLIFCVQYFDLLNLPLIIYKKYAADNTVQLKPNQRFLQ